ncbi:hypothetical protein RI129_002033 [Pyrocoelia pectoralis]|uniref:Peptidase S1 domain-containing protein n=1 Tax=Pyrocoelia pectoralis TaxID=417401 RepID=A0AAN7VKE5_9COLE
MNLKYLVSFCVIQTIFGLEINHNSRRTGNHRDARKLFGGYRITPRLCKPTRKLSTHSVGPNICMFNHECTQRNGQVVGACMDGFLFGACCQLPAGVVGELIESDLFPVRQPDNSLFYSPTTRRTVTTTSNPISEGVSKIAASLVSDGLLPTAQDNIVVQVSGDYGHFSTPGLTHSSTADTYLLQSDNNDINPDEFKQPIKISSTSDNKRTTFRNEATTVSYRPTASSPYIHISISNAPDYYTPRPPPGNKFSKPDHDHFVLVPTITQPSKPNKTQEFDSIVNIIQMLNDTSSSTDSYANSYTYTFSSTKKPPSTSYLFSLTPSRRPTYQTTSPITTISTTKKPPSTSYVFSSTPAPPRPGSKPSTTKTKPPKSSSKPTRKVSNRPSSTASSRPSQSPSSTYYATTSSRPSHSTFASSSNAYITTKKPLSTSYVYSSTISKRPTTSNTATSTYTVSDSTSQYPLTPSGGFGSSPPTIIILGPSTSSPLSSPYITTEVTTKKKPVTQVTINNHVTHNSYGTSGGANPTILITPKPNLSTIKPYSPTTEFYTPQIEVETSVNDLINFPPVRNPNLNISASIYDDGFTTPQFLEDEALNIKMDTFVNKIVQSLQEPFQGLKDVVYNKNTTIFTEVTKRPTKKPSASTNSKPTTAKKPSTKRPANGSTSKKPSVSTKKTVPPKRVTTTPPSSYETEFPATSSDDYQRYCGIRPLLKTARIVGGKGASFGEFPWQVLVRESTWLGLFTKNKCGGVLVSNRFVMTAAHCQPGFLASLVAVFGEHDISGERESKRSLSRNVKRVIVHRNYDPVTFENDLALLELEHPVLFDEHIVPICLPRDGEDFTGRMATVTGWGRLKYGGGVPSILQEVQVPIMENQVCQEMFRTAGHTKVILESFLCAGYANGQKDSCEGDSGGPLVLQRLDGRYQLAGTVSHGIKCAAPYLPGVYMRTAYYKPWIESVTGVH